MFLILLVDSSLIHSILWKGTQKYYKEVRPNPQTNDTLRRTGSDEVQCTLHVQLLQLHCSTRPSTTSVQLYLARFAGISLHTTIKYQYARRRTPKHGL